MPLDGTYEPSAWEPIVQQVALYEKTDGKEGAELQGKPCIVLWTRGRHSGHIRKTPLMRVKDGDRYAVVASLGGAPKHPVWYLNLVADPHVRLQDGAGVMSCRRTPAQRRGRTVSAGRWRAAPATLCRCRGCR